MAIYWENSNYNPYGRSTNINTSNSGGILSDIGNIVKKKANSAENALGTVGSAVSDLFMTGSQNMQRENREKSFALQRNDLARKYGFNSYDDLLNAQIQAEEEGDEGRYDNFWNEYKNLASKNANEATAQAEGYKDYRENSYAGKKINQDQGKFLGSAINTLSTMYDLSGLPQGLVANGTQGALEGLADELERGGFQNFNAENARNNAIAGGLSGLATGALNTGITRRMTNNGGRLLNNNGLISNGVNALGRSGIARGALSGAVGGAVGAGSATALQGGSMADILANAQSGARAGALQGGVMGAGMSLANRTPVIGKALNGGNEAYAKWLQSGDDFNSRLNNTLASGDSTVGNWINGTTKSPLNRLGNLGNSVKRVDNNAEMSYNKGTMEDTDLSAKYNNALNDMISAYREGVTNSDLQAMAEAYEMSDGINSNSLMDDFYKYNQTGAPANAYGDKMNAYMSKMQPAVSNNDKYEAIRKLYNENDTFRRNLDNEISEVSAEVIGEPDVLEFKDLYNDNEWLDDVYKKMQNGAYMADQGFGGDENLGIRTDAQGRPITTPVVNDKLASTRNNDLLDSIKKMALLDDEYDKGLQDYYRKLAQYQYDSMSPSEKSAFKNSALADASLDNKARAIINQMPSEESATTPVDTVDQRLNRPKREWTAQDWDDAIDLGYASKEEMSAYNAVSPKIKKMFSDVDDTFSDPTKMSIELNEDGSANLKYNNRKVGKIEDSTTIPNSDFNKLVNEGKVKNSAFRSQILGDIAYKMGDTSPEAVAERWLRYQEGHDPYEYENNLMELELEGSGNPREHLKRLVIEDIDSGEFDKYYNLELENLSTDTENDWGSENNDYAIQKLQAVYDGVGAKNGNRTAGDWLKQAGKRIVEDIKGSNLGNSTKLVDKPQEMTEDVRNMKINDNTRVEEPENPATSVWDKLTGKTSKKTNVETQNAMKEAKALKYRDASAKNLLDQMDTVSVKASKADNMLENVANHAKHGLTKPEEWEVASNLITGRNGKLSKLHTKLMASAGQVDTVNGIKKGENMEELVDRVIRENGMQDLSDGKAVKGEIMAELEKLPSRANGTLTGTDDSMDVMDVIRSLEKKARNYLGESSSNYATTTPYKEQKANALKTIATTLEDRIYDNLKDVKTIVDADTIQELKNAFPGNQKWAKHVEEDFGNIKNAKELRAVQKPYVQTNDYIQMARQNYGTYGQRVGNMGNSVSKALSKLPLVGGFAGSIADSAPANRLYANINNARAEMAEGKAPTKLTSKKEPGTGIGGKLADKGAKVYNAIKGTAKGAVDAGKEAINLGKGAIAGNDAELADVEVPNTGFDSAIGRLAGEAQAKNAEAGTFVQQAINENSQNSQNNGTTSALGNGNGNTTVYNALNGSNSQNTANTAKSGNGTLNLGSQTEIIARAMQLAMDANDANAFGALYEMYNEALANESKNNTPELTTADRSKVQSAKEGLSQIDTLEGLYNDAGGAQGIFGGTFANIGASIGNLNSKGQTYNQYAQSVGNAIVKNLVNLGGTEQDAKRYLQYLPTFTDTEEQAKTKLETLRRLYSEQLQNVYALY